MQQWVLNMGALATWLRYAKHFDFNRKRILLIFVNIKILIM